MLGAIDEGLEANKGLESVPIGLLLPICTSLGLELAVVVNLLGLDVTVEAFLNTSSLHSLLWLHCLQVESVSSYSSMSPKQQSPPLFGWAGHGLQYRVFSPLKQRCMMFRSSVLV